MWTPLSSPASHLDDRQGVVIVGSGYGGAIAAARLAMAGHSVSVLERGREWTPGQFPDELVGLAEELRSERHPLGLYDYQPGHDVDVLAGSGLGGTSLVNASVALRPTDDVFQQARWPRALREAASSGELAGLFERVERVLGVEVAGPYRGDAAPPAKVAAHERSALGRPFSLLPIAVERTREAEGPNAHGVFQRPCTYCGDCVTGCNVGAKNTLAMNYLPIAKAHGARLFTGFEVDFVLPAPAGEGGWFVFARHHLGGGAPAAERIIHARVVILAAGSLGSTGILLRSRERGLSVGKRLGHHFSANADLLGFGYNNDVATNVLGFGAHAPPRSGYRVGPVIMSMVDHRADPERGFVIQEGSVPRALVELARGAILLGGDDDNAGFRERARALARIVKDTFRAGPEGALNHSMVYLGMGHDGADGRVVLDPAGRPRVIWGAVSGRPVYARQVEEMRALVAELGGTYVMNPRWMRSFGKNPVTVHPLGGCPMGETADDGVVDDAGAVFDAAGAPHDGLYVSDGSVVPASLGANPLLTIAALSERFASKLNRRLRSPSTAVAKRPSPPIVSAPPLGLEFTERMRGFVTRSTTSALGEAGYREAEREGQVEGGPLEVRLTVLIDDVRRFIESREHEAPCEGYVDGPMFGRRVLVERGTFNLFFVDDSARTKRMRYRLELTSEVDGHPYTLEGYKELRDDPGPDLWEDTTTLFTSIRAGWSPDGTIVAQGIIRVHAADFLEQLSTFRARHSAGAAESAAGIARFGAFFFGELWASYGPAHPESPES